MDKFISLIYPGFWLSLWQYGVLAGAWFTMIEPARIFLHPRPLGEAGLGYFPLAILMGAVTVPVLLVDATLYNLTLPTGWIRRIVMAALTAGGGGMIIGFVYICAFVYASDSNNAPISRWFWMVIYGLTVGIIIFAHLYVVWRFRNGR